MKELITLTIPGTDGRQILPPENIPTLAPTGKLSAGGIFGWIISLLLLGAVLFSLGYIILGAINWITSQGDKQKIDSARRTITWALVGLIIAFMSLVSLKFISDVLGYDLLIGIL